MLNAYTTVIVGDHINLLMETFAECVVLLDPFQTQGSVLLRDVGAVLAFDADLEGHDAWANDMKNDPEFAAYWSKRL